MAGPTILNVPPREAIARFRAKGQHIGFSWLDTSAATHTHSFTVAKAGTTRIMDDIRAAMDSAIANGHGFQHFADNVRPWRNKRTGKVHQVPRGIDPGWDHNVGTAGLLPAFQQRVVRQMGNDYNTYRTAVLELMRDRDAQRYNLTDPELVGLHAYSLRHGQWAFHTINQTLRRGDDTAMAAVADRVLTLEAALQKLPRREAPVFRGTELPPPILQQYIRAAEATDRKDKVVSDSAFTSTTANPGKAYQGPHKIIVKKPDKGQKSRGSRISAFTREDEAEVLFPPGTPFEVIDMERGEGDTITFRVKEVIR